MTGNPVLPFVGDIVHVRGAEGVCSPAIVMRRYDGSTELRLRVLYRAPVTEPTGSRDAEADYPPEWDAPTWHNPDGTVRIPDTWHWRYH